jgi:HSP20 family molecular chaperone IbpA
MGKHTHLITLELLADHGGRQTHHTLHVVRVAGSVPAPGPHLWTPAADLYETTSEVVIDVNLAGIQSSIVRIDMTPKTIKLSGQRTEQVELEPIAFHLLEIERGAFERTFNLPAPIKPREAQVQYHDGLLTIRLPKASGGIYHACTAGSSEDFE